VRSRRCGPLRADLHGAGDRSGASEAHEVCLGMCRPRHRRPARARAGDGEPVEPGGDIQEQKTPACVRGRLSTPNGWRNTAPHCACSSTVDPLSRLDCVLVVTGAAAVVVATRDRARSCPTGRVRAQTRPSTTTTRRVGPLHRAARGRTRVLGRSPNRAPRRRRPVDLRRLPGQSSRSPRQHRILARYSPAGGL
jgi:hypothetical protein